MYNDTFTLFNFHATSGKWYATVFTTAHILEAEGRTAGAGAGITGGDTVEVLLQMAADQTAEAARADGSKETVQYLRPKDYIRQSDPSGYFSFVPEIDFLVIGNHAQGPETDDDYDEGYYHAMNAELDGVYMISSAAWYGLIPHFEIGGR